MENPWRILSAEQAQEWDETKLTGVEGFRMEVKRRLLWDLIAPRLPQDAARPILDLGGGTGIWAVRLAQAGYRVVLADISPGLLAKARERIVDEGVASRVETVELDMVDLTRFADEQFAMVLALGAPLSFCSDPPRAMREAFRVLAPGRAFIGDVENRYQAARFRRRAGDWPDARRILQEGMAAWPEAANPSPIRLFAPQELAAQLSEAHWQVEALYPSDLVFSLMHEGILAGLPGRISVNEVAALERELRDDANLRSAGREIQFCARKA